ncbi:hypothetical protein ACLEE4_01530 [Lonsdalea quercina]|uniref:hypothetical protein n=1 Tax=Lonsdalea quercina TaxID=71657 RepID=UPI003974E176
MSVRSALISLLVVLLLALYSLRLRNEISSQRIEHLQQETIQQSAVIAKNAFEFRRFNEVAAQASDAATRSTAQSQEKEIEYRTVLKHEKTCDLPIPSSIASGLLDYTNRLRSGAMHTDTGGNDKAGSGTTTAGGLTYCQAVLWINPLLTAIEQANNQLAGIRQIEAIRSEKKQ